MEHFTGDKLRELIIEKGISFRDVKQTLGITEAELQELLRSETFEISIVSKINESLNLGYKLTMIPSQGTVDYLKRVIESLVLLINCLNQIVKPIL